MSKANIRLGFDDVVFTAEENEKFNGWVTLYDKDGNEIGSTSAYLVGYEDEDGNETDEDGNEL